MRTGGRGANGRCIGKRADMGRMKNGRVDGRQKGGHVGQISRRRWTVGRQEKRSNGGRV